MDLRKVSELLESFCKSESPSRVQRLKNDVNLVNGIIQNLPEHFAHQSSDPVYSCLFELYRHNTKGGQQFVLQFVPVLVWTYLSVTARRDEQANGKLEALLLAIYNAEVLDDVGDQKMYRFRIPSLSRPSIYHEPSQSVTTSSTLTETALSRHEQIETAVSLPGLGRQLDRITAAHRQSVLSVVLNQYNANIAFMTEASHLSFCIMALKLAKCGFYKLCRPSKEESKEKSESYLKSEELTKLANHTRITLSTELIQEITHGLHFLMYNGQRIVATKALEDVHWRAAHGLLAPAHVLANAIKHSLEQTGGLPHTGPLGLEMCLSGQQPQATQDSSLSKHFALTSGTAIEAPAEPAHPVMTTSGMKMRRWSSPPEDAAESAVDTAEVESEVIPRKHSAMSDRVVKETNKTHKKSQSTGYFKLPFLTQKGNLELQPMAGSNGQGSARRFSSDMNIGSNRVDGVQLISSSFSDEVLDHKL